MSAQQRLTTASIAFALTISAPAAAQQTKVAPSLVDAIGACLAIKDDSQRLLCHDKAARDLVDATQRRDVVIVDKAEAKSARKSLFGFPLPKIRLFGSDGPDAGEDVARIEEKIVRQVPLPYGRYRFTLESGAIWATTEPWAGTDPHSGDMLIVRKGTMGGYFVQLKGGRTIRALRSE